MALFGVRGGSEWETIGFKYVKIQGYNTYSNDIIISRANFL